MWTIKLCCTSVDFSSSQPQSDLYGLIQVMIVVFGEEPPVFSRPTTQAPYQAFQAAGPPNRKLPVQSDIVCIPDQAFLFQFVN